MSAISEHLQCIGSALIQRLAGLEPDVESSDLKIRFFS
jgi:hypothetical protein